MLVRERDSQLKLLLITAIYFLMNINLTMADVTTTTTLIGLGDETVQTVNLVSDGIRSFLVSFTGPFWLILIVAFFSLVLVGFFALIKDVLSG